MSITIVTLDNPLKPHQRQVEHATAPLRLATWLMQRWPGGVRGTLSVVIDGEPVKLEDCEDLVLEDGQHVLLLVTPSEPGTIAVYIAKAIVAYMISKVVSAIFAPKKPTALVDQPQASPVYSITGSQNAARLGEPIPVGYGEVIQVPDFGAQPYTYFLNHDQYLDELLVIGQGEYEIREMFVGESTITSLEPGIVQWWHYPPTAHLASEGVIEDQLTESSGQAFYENVVSSPEVGDQELRKGAPIQVPPAIFWAGTMFSSSAYGHDISIEPTGTEATYAELAAWDDAPVGTERWTLSEAYVGEAMTHVWSYYTFVATAWHGPPYPEGSILPPYQTVTPSAEPIGWFDCCKPTHRGNRIMFDFVFPQGIYTVGESGLESRSCTVLIEYQRINDLGAPIGTVISHSETFSAATVNPQRITLTYDLATVGRYRARCTRTSTEPGDTNANDRVMWTGLKFRRVRQAEAVYGNVTLIAVRIKATNGIASAATSRVRFRVRRKLPYPWAPPNELATTRNPADAFVDIYTNADYGAARDVTEIDTPALLACRSSWYVHNGFNAIFAQRSTVFEALTLALQPVAAGPLPVGGLMSVQVDSVKDSRVAMFTEANLSGLVIGYEFDKIGEPAGVRIEYRDPVSFAPAFAVLPAGSLDVENVTLFGCTDATTAGQYAQLMQNRRQYQRKTITFDTELEGLMLLPGDRIGVQHQLARWGQVGIVVDVVEGETSEPVDAGDLLLHGDGADGSTTFTDTSGNAVTMTPAGNVQIDTAQSVFGGASMLFDGTGDYVQTPVHARYDLGAITASTNRTWRLRARLAASSASSEAAALYAAMVAWWTLNDSNASTFYVDSHGGHNLTLKQNGILAATSTKTGAGLLGAACVSAGVDNMSLYVPLADTACNMTDVDFSFGGWFKPSEAAGITLWLMGRSTWSFGTNLKLHAWIEINASGAIQAKYSADGTGETATANSGITTSSTVWTLIVFTYNKTANQIEIRVRKAGAGSMTKVTTARSGAIFTGTSTTNFSIGERVEIDGNSDASANRNGVQSADECFFCNKAVTDAEFDYLYNAGAGKGYATVAVDAGVFAPGRQTLIAHAAPGSTGSDKGGFALFAQDGRLGIEVGTAASSSMASYLTDALALTANAWHALAFVIRDGVAHIFVDGVEKAGSFSGGDSNFANVKLLLDFDYGSSHNGTAIVDRSPVGRTMTAVGNAKTSNVDGAYGTALCGVFDGTGDNWTAPNSTDFDFGSGDFTIEGTAYPSTVSSTRLLYANRASSGFDNGCFFFATSGAKLQFIAWNNGTVIFNSTSSASITLNTKFDWAITRSGTTIRVFINGALDTTLSSISAAIGASNGLLWIGSSSLEDGTRDWNGRMYRVRVTKGVARYTAAYTPAVWPTFLGSGAASFIGIDTTREDYPLRLGAPLSAGNALAGWLDEINVSPDAKYSANYTPETEPFPDYSEGATGAPLLTLDRGLDWDAVDEPHAVLLSDEVNGVSASILCERGDADHIVNLLAEPPFTLFGKGEHQEQTRVAFGTLDSEVRDWIVTAAQPNADVGVRVDAITYRPEVYVGAMPHQGFPPTEGEIPVASWIVAGDPAAPSLEVVGAGEPADELAVDIVGGTPVDPSAPL